MKNRILKKGTSAILAAVMCFSICIGSVGTAVNAATEKKDAYMVSFPREGDRNYDEDWRTYGRSLMNGWEEHSNWLTTLHTLDDYGGPICYCIEPGTSRHNGDTLHCNDEDFWDNYPSVYNNTIIPRTIKQLLGRVMYYGYRGDVSLDWVSQNEEDADNLAYAMATQILVWETVVGERDDDFNHVDPGDADSVKSIYSTEHPLYDRFCYYYDYIVDCVQSHADRPSFMARKDSSATTVELLWNGSAYVATLEDTNSVLEYYSFTSDDPNVSFSVSGNQLTVSSPVAPSDNLLITAEKKNSERCGVVVWSDAKYGPDGDLQDLISWGTNVFDPVQGFLKVKVSNGSCKIVKASEDDKVSGISFTITGNGVNQTVVTGDNGEIQIDNLAPGVYTVTEVPVDIYATQDSQTVTVVSGQTATVSFNNTLRRGELKVIKSSEDNCLEGFTFHLYGTSLCGLPVDEYAVTDASGVAHFTNVLISGSTPYTIEEVNTPDRYVVPTSQTAAIEWNNVTNRNFTNTLKKFVVEVTKTDVETVTYQGDASLAGAVYGIYHNGELIDTYTTDENGKFTSKEYVCGENWTIQEITPSRGYQLDSTVYSIGAEAQLYEVEHNTTSNTVVETVKKGNVSIIKHADDGDTQIERPENGAVFEIYLKSAGSFEAAGEDVRDTLITDEYGFAQSKDMPFGTYVVHQVSGWEGRELMSDFEVFISDNGKTYRYLINNKPFESYVQIIKVDAETGNTISYAGAGFQIFDPAGDLVEMTFTYPSVTTIDTFYTDVNGQLITPESLEYGEGYSLVEVQAPFGYVLDSTSVYFDITPADSSEESGVNVIKVTKSDYSQMGTISISKTGEVFWGVNVSGGVDESGNELPVIYQPVYQEQFLAGAVYEIRAAEDIITPDGTVRVTEGTVVDTLTTIEEVEATSVELYLGKYEIEEIEAPYGMVRNTAIRTVELTYEGQDVSITETSESFVNERQKIELSLVKELESDAVFGIGNNGEIGNITFGLFAAEELVSSSGTVIPADGLIEIAPVDADGTLKFASDIPFGKYYVQELTTDEHYVLNDEKFYVEVTYEGQDTATVFALVNDGEPIRNEIIYGRVKGKKVDEFGNNLQGAVIGLFRSPDDEFTEDNALMTTVSAEDGSFSFENLPYGTYYLRELASPEGYVLSDVTYSVNVSQDEQVITIALENFIIRGNITLTKVDADYPENKLTGATFEVYDAEMNLVGNLTEDSEGIYSMYELAYGKYFVKETVAPEGFRLDEGTYEVNITEDGKTYVVENEAGVGFINRAQTGSLTIVKTSTDGKLSGFSFRVTGPNGYDQTFVTDENGHIVIGDLRIGQYLVSEVSNDANASYILPADVVVNIVTDTSISIEMHNIFRDTPKTGDDFNLPLLITISSVSAAGIAVCVTLLLKKKKEVEES